LIEPIVPTRTATAPNINIKFDKSNSASARADVISHIRNLAVLGFGAVCILGLIAVYAALERVVKSWKKLRMLTSVNRRPENVIVFPVFS
jgi:hypothetical protein